MYDPTGGHSTAVERTSIGYGALTPFGGRAYEIRTEDGISATFDWYIGLTHNDVDYVHPQPFRWLNDAQAFIAKIYARGSVDLSKWNVVDPGPTLEERLGPFGIEWERDQMERMGLIPCA